MKVILLGELRGKGGEGDIVDVAQGFAENFLFPNKIAQPATPGNIKQLEERRHNIEKREAERIASAEATKAALDGKSVTVDAKIGEEGQLFGSVTARRRGQPLSRDLRYGQRPRRRDRGGDRRGGGRGRRDRGGRRGRDRRGRRVRLKALFNAPLLYLRVSTITAGQESVRNGPQQCAAAGARFFSSHEIR